MLFRRRQDLLENLVRSLVEARRLRQDARAAQTEQSVLQGHLAETLRIRAEAARAGAVARRVHQRPERDHASTSEGAPERQAHATPHVRSPQSRNQMRR
eukprot:scaffold7059_cov250-Pinguiococcus_pyrenoidosus.AAC.19